MTIASSSHKSTRTKPPFLTSMPHAPILFRFPLLPIETLSPLLTYNWESAQHQQQEKEKETSLAIAFQQDLEAIKTWVQHQLTTAPFACALQEALLIASPDLTQALPTLFQHSKGPLEKRSEHVLLKVFRYLLRMATRPTPFGLCAGVTAGFIGEVTSVYVEALHTHQKRTRPDMLYLLSFIRILEQRQDVRDQLIWSPNPLLYQGTRLILPYATIAEQQGIHIEELSLHRSPVLEDILALTRTELPLASVKHQVATHHTLSTNEIDQMIDGLCTTEVLLSELRPPPTHESPLEYLLDRLTPLVGVEDIRDALLLQQTQCRSYDTFAPGQGYSALTLLFQSSQPLHVVPTTIEVDYRVSCTSAQLSHEVVNEITHAAELLCRLSPQSLISPALQTYASRFQVRYGPAREVPLLEMLDEIAGLGVPPTYQSSMPQATSSLAGQELPVREQALFSFAAKALKEHRREIVLTEGDLSRLQRDSDWQQDLPDTLELFVTIAASSQAAINHGDFLIGIGPRCGCAPAGRSFGRFCHMLDADVTAWLHQLALEEAEAHPEILFAELVYLPAHGRAANVVLRPSLRSYEIPIGTVASRSTATLALDTLLVGVHSGQLYLRSQELGKEVKIRNTHLLNLTRQTPPVVRFLTEVAGDLAPHLHLFSWGKIASFPFLPRLRVGKCLLSPAQWHFPLASLRTMPHLLHDPLQWYQHIQAWRDEWLVPRYVWLTDSDPDQKMLLDLDNPLSVIDLQQVSKKYHRHRESLPVQEVFPDLAANWVRGEQGHYRMECVVPLKRVKSRTRESLPSVVSPARTRDRLCLPGSDWLYARLYCREEQHNEILTGPLRLLLDYFKQQMRCFFVRYHDPTPHLRLRFQGVPTFLIGEFFPVCVAWLQELIQQGWISHFVFEGYEREIERYGGVQGMEIAEALFVVDSRLVLELLALPLPPDGVSREEVAIVSIDHFLQGLNLSWQQRAQFYQPYLAPANEEKRDGYGRTRHSLYQSQRQRFLHLVGDPSWLHHQPGGEALANCLHTSLSPLATLREQLQVIPSEQQSRFLRGQIHMHCNRLLGKTLLEQDLLYYLARVYQQLAHSQSPGIYAEKRDVQE
jgi:lantibiotic biosynthesis protein